MSIKRNKIKKNIQAKKKKTFRRQESWRLVRANTSWRKARGIECKMRIRHRGSKGGLPVHRPLVIGPRRKFGECILRDTKQ